MQCIVGLGSASTSTQIFFSIVKLLLKIKPFREANFQTIYAHIRILYSLLLRQRKRAFAIIISTTL